MTTFLLVAMALLLVVSTLHFLALFATSRRGRRPAPDGPGGDDLFFVFVIPCLDEARVVARSVARLLELPQRRVAVLVVDDGSDDGTAEAVRPYLGDHVWLLERRLPEARQGKGAALNAAHRHLVSSGRLAHLRPDQVVVTVLDADGRLQPNALYEVGPAFADPRVGAVQVGVRMNNTHAGLLAVMQDVEFVTYTEVLQRGRDHLQNPGMGGNGQFVRLSALASIGPDPWSDCLTEDLDLGLRLLAAGWRTSFCARTWVSQQAITSWRRLLRQRTRWIQGHLQCWARLPLLVRSPLPRLVVADLCYHLVSPVLMLAVSTASLALAAGLAVAVVQDGPRALAPGGWPILAATAVLSFALAPCLAFVYWLRERHLSPARALPLALLYQLYTYLWVLAGWRAAARIATGRSSWAKTARSAELAGTATGPGPTRAPGPTPAARPVGTAPTALAPTLGGTP